MKIFMHLSFAKTVFLTITLIALSGCAGLRNTVGIERTVPDEFAIAAPAPLVMPPDFSLRPPAPGTERAQAPSAERARTALVGRARIRELQQKGMTVGEAQILTLAGFENVATNIRSTLDKEISSFAREESAFTNQLLFWRGGSSASLEGTALDPVAEMKRLSQNTADGRDANEGPIPIISRGGSSALKIF